jgi:hypothetical protein
MPDPVAVFVSHSHRDDAFTQRLVADLTQAGATVWVDVAGVGAGDFQKRINDALVASNWVVVVMSQNALNSPWVEQEVNAAIRLKHQGRIRDIIPLQAGPVDPQTLPPLWGVFNIFDATQDYAAAFAQLRSAMGLAVPAVPASPILPAVPATSATPPSLQAATPLLVADSAVAGESVLSRPWTAGSVEHTPTRARPGKDTLKYLVALGGGLGVCAGLAMTGTLTLANQSLQNTLAIASLIVLGVGAPLAGFWLARRTGAIPQALAVGGIAGMLAVVGLLSGDAHWVQYQRFLCRNDYAGSDLTDCLSLWSSPFEPTALPAAFVIPLVTAVLAGIGGVVGRVVNRRRGRHPFPATAMTLKADGSQQ